jgi:radical SAM superfamily enzyme
LDTAGYPTLAELLREIHEIPGIERIRFLTSHPNWITDELLDTVRELPKVMKHIEVPAQAGNNMVLENMRRGYTDEEYRNLISHIREKIPGVSIGTDIIVGFPGETEAQFEDTFRQLADLKLNVVHLAVILREKVLYQSGRCRMMSLMRKNGGVFGLLRRCRNGLRPSFTRLWKGKFFLCCLKKNKKAVGWEEQSIWTWSMSKANRI